MSEIRYTFIYALVDPRDDRVRYVGKSDNPRQRLTAHKRGKECNPYRARWIAQLKAAGLEPVLLVLEECPIDDWQERERFWEQHFRKRGERLTNLAECGEGRIFYCSTSEFREKMREVNAEVGSRPEVREKRSVAVKACWADPEWRAAMMAARQAKRIPRTKESRSRSSAAFKKVRERWRDQNQAPEFNVKDWEGFIGPDGRRYGPIHNLSAFCREHGLSAIHMAQVARGKRHSHHGWRALGGPDPLA